MNGRRVSLTMTGLLLIGLAVAAAPAPGQEPPRAGDRKAESADHATRAAQLRARLELTELDHDVSTELLKESILLLRRAERSRQIEGRKQAEPASANDEEIRRLSAYIDERTESYTEQVMAIDRLRRELMQLEPAPRTPLSAGNLAGPGIRLLPEGVPSLQPGAAVEVQGGVRAEPLEVPAGREEAPAAIVAAPAAASNAAAPPYPALRGTPEELLDQADELEQEVLLLEVRLQVSRQALDAARQQLAILEAEASKPENRGDKAHLSKIESARHHFRQVRKDRFDLAQRLAREQKRLELLRQVAEPGPGVVRVVPQ